MTILACVTIVAGLLALDAGRHWYKGVRNGGSVELMRFDFDVMFGAAVVSATTGALLALNVMLGG